jgi:hypothetical protein
VRTDAKIDAAKRLNRRSGLGAISEADVVACNGDACRSHAAAHVNGLADFSRSVASLAAVRSNSMSGVTWPLTMLMDCDTNLN